jgi:hypothetical protein
MDKKKKALRQVEAPGGKRKLFRAEDGVFRGLGDAEFHDALGLDLDGFAGLRVATHAGGAVLEDELADAGQREGVLRVLVGERGEMFRISAACFLESDAFSAIAATSWDLESALAIMLFSFDGCCCSV